MSVHYERWLIARGNVFLPSAATVAKLIERLRAERWIPLPEDLAKLRFEGAREAQAKATGGYAVKTVENRYGTDRAAKIAASTEPQPTAVTGDWLDASDREEIRLVWPVSAADASVVRFPLSKTPDGAVAYALELHRAPEYIYPSGKTLGKIPVTCKCGEDLSFEWDEDEIVAPFDASTGIFAECDECSRTFDPSTGSATIKNPFDGSAEKVPGGAAHRFAVKIDWPGSNLDDPKVTFAPELVALVEKEFGRSFYEVARVS